MQPVFNENPTVRILLVGPSGGGKSTFMNLLWFLSQKTSLSNQKNSLISTMFLKGQENNIQKVGTQCQSRTIRPEQYSIPNFDIGEKKFDLQIIDTPGFLDTQGQGQDKLNLEEIRKFSCERALNGVLVVLNEYSFSNDDYCSEYIMNMIKQVVGANSDNKNIRFLVTNCSNASSYLNEAFIKNFPGFENTFEFYNNHIFNEDWSILEEKKTLKLEKYIKKELLPKCQNLIGYFSTLSQNKLTGIKNLDSKIELFREKILTLYYNLCDSLANAVYQSETMSKKNRINEYFIFKDFKDYAYKVCTNCTECYQTCCSNCRHYTQYSMLNLCKVPGKKCNACECNIIHHKKMNYQIVEDSEYHKTLEAGGYILTTSEFKKICLDKKELDLQPVVSQKKDLHLNELKKVINDVFQINDQTNLLSEWHSIKEKQKIILGKKLDGTHLKAFDEIETFLLSYFSRMAYSPKSFVEIEEMFTRLKVQILENGEYDKQVELHEFLLHILKK